MSKKNNLKTRARRHAHDLQLEKEAAQKKQEAAAKRKQKTASKGITKAKLTKRKTVRLKKGKRVKGIKITDAESKQKAKDLLKAEQALRQSMGKMDVDSDGEWVEATEAEVAAMATD